METLVDTGASFTVLPGTVLQGTGVTFHTRELFTLAYGWQVESDVVQTWVRIDGRSVLTSLYLEKKGKERFWGPTRWRDSGVGLIPPIVA